MVYSAIVLAAVVVVAVLTFYCLSFPFDISTSQEIWGQFGDYFGGVLNPILSFFALTGLMITLRAQQAESNRAEKRHEASAFDSRLFQLLSLMHTSVSSVKFMRAELFGPSVEYDGHRAVGYALNRLQEDYLYLAERGLGEEMYERLMPEYAAWTGKYWSGIANYIESVLFVIEYVLASKAGKDDLDFAMRAVFAQMSSDEKLLVFYVMIFSLPQKIFIFEGMMDHGLFGSASKDDLMPFRSDLINSAIMQRLLSGSVG
ncbi:hypothetical protein AO256_19355 [Pseudomonas syringae]|nr:hypothetical protein CCL21_28500 [Pseudomonas syringae]PHN25670.1 hypothetical protein AO256_19355 [Pseudomonas syringae]PHX33640.1 hypothetical protein AO278_06390 [Pseudomonas syringae pv. syringae]POD64126.1 hypothetical protein BKM13_00450 [Pseudomonas syringae pv. syringae]